MGNAVYKLLTEKARTHFDHNPQTGSDIHVVS